MITENRGTVFIFCLVIIGVCCNVYASHTSKLPGFPKELPYIGRAGNANVYHYKKYRGIQYDVGDTDCLIVVAVEPNKGVAISCR